MCRRVILPQAIQLIFWTDHNHDGVSQPNEIQSLSDVRITQLATSYRESRRTDRHGNIFRYVGRALVRRRVQPVPATMVDVILRVAPPSLLETATDSYLPSVQRDPAAALGFGRRLHPGVS